MTPDPIQHASELGQMLFFVVPIPALVAFVAGMMALSRDEKAIEAGSRNKRAIAIATWIMFGAVVLYFAMYWYSVEWQYVHYTSSDRTCPATRSALRWHALPWFAIVLAGWTWLTIVFALRIKALRRSVRQIKVTLWVVGVLTLCPFVYTFSYMGLVNFGETPPKVNFCVGYDLPDE